MLTSLPEPRSQLQIDLARRIDERLRQVIKDTIVTYQAADLRPRDAHSDLSIALMALTAELIALAPQVDAPGAGKMLAKVITACRKKLQRSTNNDNN